MSPEYRIRKEFNEPPSVVLQGLANLGYGKNATASILGLHIQTLRRMARDYSVSFKPYIELNETCKGGSKKAKTSGPTSKEHKQKISEAMTRKWKERKRISFQY